MNDKEIEKVHYAFGVMMGVLSLYEAQSPKNKHAIDKASELILDALEKGSAAIRLINKIKADLEDANIWFPETADAFKEKYFKDEE